VDKDKLNKIRENIKLFLKSAFDMEDRSSALIKKKRQWMSWITLCFYAMQTCFPLKKQRRL